MYLKIFTGQVGNIATANARIFDFLIIYIQTAQNQRVSSEPPSKKYKRTFKQTASDRRVYDRRNLKALDRTVKI